METTEQQLNADVNSVQELLLLEAKRILAKTYTEDEIKTLDELKSLGFKNTQEQKAYEDWKRAQKVTEYSKAYPMNKFITEGAVKDICEKYGLLLANVGDYQSDIPMDNQKAIVNFKVKKEDVDNILAFTWPMFPDFLETERIGMMISRPRRNALDSFYFLGTDPINEPVKPKKTEWVKAKNLKVIAPPSKLNLAGKEIVGHCLIDKDPIVLQPVKDGYLIVTAWGFEAKDPEVQNPRHN